MQENLVSIIVPAYNVQEYLGDCIESILSQTYTNVEIIIVDDGSTDKTFKVGNQYCIYNNNLKLLRQKNRGVSVARNTGIACANGEYIVFVDADDVLDPKYIETLIHNINNSDMAVVGYSSKIDDLGKDYKKTEVNVSSRALLNEMLDGVNFNGYLWNKIFRRSIIDTYNLRFLEQITVWEDMYFVLQYLSHISLVNISSIILYFYRYREGSAVNTIKLDKYKSKYYVMKSIRDELHCYRNRMFDNKSGYLYYETMFSYINKCFKAKEEICNADAILKQVNLIDLLKYGTLKLVVKYLYLTINRIIKYRILICMKSRI